MMQNLATRKIIHIDMDCFYAAVEMRDRPALQNKPLAVGGSPDRRGVLCTSNYVARQYGVRSAMASAYAKKLCPQLIILPVDMPKYRNVSRQIRQIFFEFTDLVEPLSLDEAYLDVTHCQQLHNSASLIAEEIRQQIVQQQQLTASAGVAPCKFLAKIASDWHKPNGLKVITPNAVKSFVSELPVTKIFGVGKVTARKLQQLNLQTCADLQKLSLEVLKQHFGKFGQRLYELSRGIDDRAVEPNRIRKSLSVERTYPEDLSSLQDCLASLPTLLRELQQRLQNAKQYQIHKQFVKIKFYDFKQTTVETLTTEPSLALFTKLLREGYERQAKPVRLLGIGVGFVRSIETQDSAKQYSFDYDL